MKAAGAPFPLAFLLLLLGAAAWNQPLPAPWHVGLLPGLALLGVAVGWVSGQLPARIWVAGGFALGLIALYAGNAAYGWSEGRGLMPRAHVAGLPASAYAAGTWAAFRLALAAFAAFALAFGLSRRQIRGLQGIAAAAATAMALAVLAQRLEPNAPRIREYTGIFVNENHFAVFANLLLPVVLVMASRARFRAVQVGAPSSPAGLFYLAAAVLAAAVVACGSRAGMAVLALLVAAHVGLCRWTVRQYPFAGIPPSAGHRILGALAVSGAAALAVRAFRNEWHQIAAIGREWAFRSGILKDALGAWREHPAWGVGPGTFATVFPYYRSAAFEGRTLLHAHCEPVQFLVEFGVAGALAFSAAVAVALSARPARAFGGADEMPPFADLERRAFGLGLLACGLHGGVDFPLRIPLLALLAAAWAGIWAGTRPAAIPERSA